MDVTTAERPIKLLCEVADMIHPLASYPPCQHWLCSDATFSYCWPCARLARWFEMDRMGPPPPPSDCLDRSKTDEEILKGIDGGDWYSGESDTPQSCEMCHCLLRFSLTSYGVAYTMEGFEAPSIGPEILDNADAVYELEQILSHGAWCEEPELVTALMDVAEAVKTALAARAQSEDASGKRGE